MTLLKRSGLELNLELLFPPNKRTPENIKNSFLSADLLDVVTYLANQVEIVYIHRVTHLGWDRKDDQKLFKYDLQGSIKYFVLNVVFYWLLLAYLMTLQGLKPVQLQRIVKIRQYKLCSMVSEVSSIVGSPVYICTLKRLNESIFSERKLS